jgi:cytochrome c
VPSLEHNGVDPRHCGLFGRQSGSLKDYQYSAAMKKHGVTWNDETVPAEYYVRQY